MVVDNRGRIYYARWEVRIFRGIERFSDYKKVKTKMRRVVIDNVADVPAPRGAKRGWRSLRSDKIIAVGTIALVLLTAATLIVLIL
jgi:hypothetical protein